MIRFSLACERGHGFESWFADGASFDDQARRGLVRCAVCDSEKVSKAMMAPAVHAGRRAAAAPVDRPYALINDEQRELRAAMTELKRKIEANTVDVGERFPELARAIHSGDEPEQAIRGKASPDEARALIGDGIAVMPMPVAPGDAN